MEQFLEEKVFFFARTLSACFRDCLLHFPDAATQACSHCTWKATLTPAFTAAGNSKDVGTGTWKYFTGQCLCWVNAVCSLNLFAQVGYRNFFFFKFKTRFIPIYPTECYIPVLDRGHFPKGYNMERATMQMFFYNLT